MIHINKLSINNGFFTHPVCRHIGSTILKCVLLTSNSCTEPKKEQVVSNCIEI